MLALVGIYALLSFWVRSRQREIAVRVAIGARSRNVLGLVLGEGLRLIILGLVVGIDATFALARFLRAFLFGVGPTDPLTLAGVGILFTAVALLASWLPARRATTVDPVIALRQE
jgi:ABC-type antimicrobial peptide transport system permease subunit